jgi:hypothetical protein
MISIAGGTVTGRFRLQNSLQEGVAYLLVRFHMQSLNQRPKCMVDESQHLAGFLPHLNFAE